jgi:hypothetical protein
MTEGTPQTINKLTWQSACTPRHTTERSNEVTFSTPNCADRGSGSCPASLLPFVQGYGHCAQSHLPTPTPNVCESTQATHNMDPNSNIDEFDLPAPPPALHTRGSDMGRPGTPSQEGFTRPQQTPQGSPSKSHQPPGAFDLPHVFENAMKLLPTIGSPSKSKPGTPTSPNKSKLQGAEEADPFRDDVTTLTPGSPTRKSNKENTPPNARPGLQKETSYITHAAQSRQEPYRTQRDDQSQRYYPGPQRLSAEDLEKARKPSVKRLANVTQLCMCIAPSATAWLIQR